MLTTDEIVNNRKYIRKLLCLWYGPRPDLEDVEQEVVIKLIRTAHSFRGDCSPRTWIYRVARNVSINLLRRNQLRTCPLDLEKHDVPCEDRRFERMENRQEAARMVRKIRRMPRRLRSAFYWTKMRGLTYVDAGRRMNKSADAVGVRVYRVQQAIMEAAA